MVDTSCNIWMLARLPGNLLPGYSVNSVEAADTKLVEQHFLQVSLGEPAPDQWNWWHKHVGIVYLETKTKDLGVTDSSTLTSEKNYLQCRLVYVCQRELQS